MANINMGINMVASIYYWNYGIKTLLKEGLFQLHAAGESHSDVRRLRELADPNCNHDWLWALCPDHGPTLQAAEFVEAARLRLGAGGPEEPVPCRLCGAVLDSAGSR